LTLVPDGRHNDGMASPETTSRPKPFQFGLRSIFLATAAVGVTFGLLRWLGPGISAFVFILAVQCAVVRAILVISKGAARTSVVTGGFWGGAVGLMFVGLGIPFILCVLPFFVSLGAWFGGGLWAAYNGRSLFLRWAFSLLFAWCWFLVTIFTFLVLPFVD